MDITKIKALAFTALGETRSHDFKEKGNKYYHGERVAKLVISLRKIIFPLDDSYDEILVTAALFHDIANGGDNHAEEGALKTKEILTEYCTEIELEKICQIISVHDDRSSTSHDLPWYIKLHQDADQLDHFGTYEIWMSFLFAISHNETIADVNNWLNNKRLEKVDKHRNELHFEISKRIFDEKMAFEKAFSARFNIESSGGIWNENDLL